MRWIWDPEKNRANTRKHGISFETARLVFGDPLAMSRPDPSAEDERWQTVGSIGRVVVFVVHIWPEPDRHGDEEIGRIISARKATSHERKAYEDAWL
ncbi:MAG: BrnT family toxin [Proteobacteria bacterium]|nr:BrnT family toxin [Pseudomonadota bacterium]MBI3498304.1 BrnT family toxin [Pseudomonadota bacterium]